MNPISPPFACASLIKEIGRGAHGARALSRDSAHDLYAAMLDGRVGDVELGAILIAYRIKGETPAELAGMLGAAHAHIAAIDAPAGACRPVAIPSYNGARKQPNLTPLLAMLLAREGVPVVVHGVRTDAGRVTSAEIFAALGIDAAASAAQAAQRLADDRLAFVPIDVLSPGMTRLLQLRAPLGVRNTTHTLVKLLDPFRVSAARPDGAVRLVNYTHPPYRDSLTGLFGAYPDIAHGDVLLARGTEGEAVADTRRQVQIDWLRDGRAEILVSAARREADAAAPRLPASLEAAATADWIREVLMHTDRIPDAILRQVDDIARIARSNVSKSL
ncbi:DNA-binding protein YbiB [Robbsia sp. Bb-Pol-6]|uniref:DNA-binding protein YbiB n=1 Tax=Robbsia betulipollinis TaxID=2981849 RepID=A0ABT3ZLL5_9BURK|nr:DNA-binding protein YbiB [Robbsia betulipollinis]MCY0387165.1 DNA-binding protein YbiB [Robbsia betulipollinis]